MDFVRGEKMEKKFQQYYKKNIMKKLNKDELYKAVEYLGTEDEKFRTFIGNLILHNGDKSLDALLYGQKYDNQRVRRSSLFLLNRLLKKNIKLPKKEILKEMYRNLNDEDPKIRKNSAVVLGTLQDSQSTSFLIKALEKEEIFWVRSSIILALGAIADEEVKEFFANYKSKGPLEEEALRKVLDKLMRERNQLQMTEQLREELLVEFWTFPGLEAILKKDLKEKLHLSAKKMDTGVLSTTISDLSNLFSVRTFHEFLIPFGSVPFNNGKDISIKELLTPENIEKLTSIYKDEITQLRYRIEVRGSKIKHYERQKILRQIKKEILNHPSLFVNSPSSYDIELRAIIKGNRIKILWKPFGNIDQRFAYRVGDIPASIHPVVAAGVIGSLNYQESKNHRVLDPFCGSGTMLVERAMKADYKELVGVDISPKAISVANKNSKAANLKNVRFVQSDIRDFSDTEKFHEIIANMPFGLRVGDHQNNITLYKEFFSLIPSLLEKNGVILLYTQEINLTKKLFKQSKHLKLEKVFRVETGGLHPAVFIGKRV